MLDSKYTFHHTGMAVDSIEETLVYYKQLFGEDKISQVFEVSSQGVNVCFVEVAPNCFLELVEAANEESSINRMRRKGVSYYHVAYKVSNIESCVAELENLNFKAMDYFHSEAFDNLRCIFLYTPDAQLIELIESN